MPIHPSLLAFGNEATFRDSFVMPLLLRLGFGVVLNYHGQREFGRDIVFGDLDRLGHFVYYGMQLKFEPSVSLSASHDIANDAEQATRNPFRHPSSGRQEYISTFYVANAGDISDAARDNFFNIVGSRGIRDARLLDGNALVLLDKSATLTRVGMVRERLQGLLREIERNKRTSASLMEKLQRYATDPATAAFPLLRCRYNAASSYLEEPFVIPGLNVDVVDQYFETARMINNMADSIGFPILNGDYVRHRTSYVAEVVARLNELGSHIHDASRSALERLGASAA